MTESNRDHFTPFFPKKSDLLKEIENICTQGYTQSKTVRPHEKDQEDKAVTFPSVSIVY